MQNILRMSQLFSAIDDQSAKEIIAASSLIKASPNQMIFTEGDHATGCFIVARGKIKLFKLSSEGKEQILMIAKPGDTFAEAALFAGGKYPASAQTLEATELLVINREKFVGLIRRDPNLALNLIARMAQLLHKLTQLVEGLSLSDVTARLARRLMQLLQANGENADTISLSEKKVVLAAEIGTIPETLSRSLARLTKDKIIAVDGSEIKVLDLARLRQIAQS